MKAPSTVAEIEGRSEAIERQTKAYERSNDVLTCRVDTMQEAMSMLEKGMALMGVALCAKRVREANEKSWDNGARIGTLETRMQRVSDWAERVKEENKKLQRQVDRMDAQTKANQQHRSR